MDLPVTHADFSLADVEARWERILCPTNIRKAPKNPNVLSVVNKSSCTLTKKKVRDERVLLIENGSPLLYMD